MKSKPWQLVVIVLGLLVGAVSIGWALTQGDAVDLPHRLTVVDVESGQLYDVDTSRVSMMVPGPHPETGKFTLIPCYKDETSGKWMVSSRDARSLRDLDKSIKVTAVDLSSGEFLVEPKAPIKYRPAKK